MLAFRYILTSLGSKLRIYGLSTLLQVTLFYLLSTNIATAKHQIQK